MVTVKFFASLKQKVGKSELTLNISEPSTVGEIIKRLESELPELERAISDTKSVVAVNHEFGRDETIVNDGDELAFIPPMSGGSELVRIQAEDFSINDEIDRIKKVARNIGGIVTFLGTARDISRGRVIRELDFEHYPVMAEKKLAEIRERALADFDIIELIVVHRFGKIDIGENIVLIAAAAEHRAAAFDACEWAIDELKQITPIWKKEMTDTGEIWVEDHP